MSIEIERGGQQMPARGLGNRYQGSKWITRERRLAIYLRDGLACVYCGATIEDGTTLSLDHITPKSQGGSNASGNLVTACRTCNSARNDRSIEEFTASIAAYLNHGLKAEDIVASITRLAGSPVDITEARNIIARRGSWAAVLRR
jgi:hypothetical protein